MKRSRFSDEQIVYTLRHAEGDTAVADVCQQLDFGGATCYPWKEKYGPLGATDARELRFLHGENRKLRRLVAGRTLDKHILGEIIRKAGRRRTPR